MYVTCFNQEIYDASGKDLLNSFDTTDSQAACWAIGFEGMDVKNQLTKAPALYLPLDNHKIKQNVFNDNIEVIPDYLGGKYKTPCKCKKPWGKREDAHVPHCSFTWWNRNFYRWLNKIVTLYDAINYTKHYEFNAVIWLDSDCFFKNRLKEETIAKVLSGKDIFFMKGRSRRIIESGVIGFNLNGRGEEIITKWLGYYTSSRFRSFPRWDDGFVLDHLLFHDYQGYKLQDIIPPNVTDTDVGKHSVLRKYIEHQKGLHGRILGIMK